MSPSERPPAPFFDAQDCQDRLGHRFADPTLLRAALVHSSGADSPQQSNERLEFLGDAILGMIVCEYLHGRYPQRMEGELTRMKSVAVSRRTCTAVARRLGLASDLFVGRGLITQKELPGSVLAAVCEAVIAAIYLDGGLPAARGFVLAQFVPVIDRIAADEGLGNAKSTLQHLAQRQFGAVPTYEMVAQSGPDHRKSFRVTAVIGGRRFPPAWGDNKKQAQQNAAANALQELEAESQIERSGEPVAP